MKLIRNVLLASGNSFKKVNVLFSDTIQQIGVGNFDLAAVDEEYDFSDCIIIPGAVDMHVHLLDGSNNEAKNIEKVSRLALSGGYTTLANLSFTTTNPLVKAAQVKHYIDLIEQKSACDVALWGQCDFSEFPYHLNNMHELWSAGVAGFLITHPSSNTLIEDMSYEDIMGLFDTIYDTDVSFSFQGYDSEDASQSKDFTEQFIAKRLVSIRKLLRRIQDNPLHFIGIYDVDSIELLNNAFRRADLTYAVPIAQLIKIISKFRKTGYTKDEAFSEFVKLLFDSMKNGKLYTLSTQAGKEHPSDDRLCKQAFSGYSESLLQWGVPWVFSELWKNGRASIQSCIRMVSENPAKRLGLFPVKGCIQKGSDADMTIIDPRVTVESALQDHEGNPLELSCAIKATFLRGCLYQGKNNKSFCKGKFVRRTGTTRRKTNSSCWN
jgi:dihydroorotase-like cyclic amidohydrolase